MHILWNLDEHTIVICKMLNRMQIKYLNNYANNNCRREDLIACINRCVDNNISHKLTANW